MRILILALATIMIVGPKPAYAGHGHTGPAGPQGPIGPAGTNGSIGAQGAAGHDGTDVNTNTKILLSGDVRIWDLKHASLFFFDNYNWFDQHNDSYGVRVGFKLGSSYEERQMDELKKQLLLVIAVAGEKIRQNDAEMGELKMRLNKMEAESPLQTGRKR